KKETVGTGPLGKFVSHDQQTRTIVERNPYYWMPDRPYVDKAETFYQLDLSARLAAFAAKQNDYIVLTDKQQLRQAQLAVPDLRYSAPLNTFSPQFRFHMERAPFNDL